MTLATTAAFLKRLLRLGGSRQRAKSRVHLMDPAEMGTAFGLESTMVGGDEIPFVPRLSVEGRPIMRSTPR